MRRKKIWIAASCLLPFLVLFSVFSSGAPPASKEKVIYSFKGGTDGAYPLSDLTFDADGNLYGTTSAGGTGSCNGGCGTVLELKRTKDGWKKQTLYSFKASGDAAVPEAGLVFDNAGNLYGTTVGGGKHGIGTVFKLAPDSHGGWVESVIYNFDETAGDGPQADLAFDKQGNLYGTTSEGTPGECGNNGCGALFELTPQPDGTWIETTVHTFAGSPDGGVPSSGVAFDSAGNMYGVTVTGGTGNCKHPNLGMPGCGAVYKVVPNSGGGWTESVIYSFTRGGGFAKFPAGNVLFNQASHLVGLSQEGGDGIGTIFELKDNPKQGWQQTILHRFYGERNGARPTGSISVGQNGHMFGATEIGGAVGGAGCGVVFELQPSLQGWKERTLHSFNGGSDGATPQAGPVSDSQGRVYGTTKNGGSGVGCNEGYGTVYEITP
jgi:uncharacterized repeat protein (TIGR03803 family)